jgi:hypothetical protein
MATYNSFSLPFAIPTVMQYGITYALLPVPGKLLGDIPVLFSTTYGGAYTSLANSNIAPGAAVNGGFVKAAASPVNVVITRNSFKK